MKIFIINLEQPIWSWKENNYSSEMIFWELKIC